MSVRVAIVGGGISGLATAHYLKKHRPDLELWLFEEQNHLGGNIVTEEFAGFLLDRGPDSFLTTKPHALALCKELGLENELISPEPSARHVFIAENGKLEPLPGGMVLTVPTRLAPLLETPLLSLAGKLRFAADLLLPFGFGKRRSDESIGEFMTRRFGAEVAQKLAQPLLGGIFAGNIQDLSLAATFPQLVDLESRYGSVILGLFAAQHAKTELPRGRLAALTRALSWFLRRVEASAPAPSPFTSLKRGLGGLITRLAETALVPERVILGQPLRGLQRAPDGQWQLEVGTQRLPFHAVVLATPAHAAAKLVPHAALARELASVAYVSTATVFFAFKTTQALEKWRGSGFLVPHAEGQISAATWISQKWAQRAPAGHSLLRAYLGGVMSKVNVAQRSDAELRSLALRELERFMGQLPSPEFSRVFRYEKARPQPNIGHLARLARISRELTHLPGLYLAASSCGGSGIPDCVRKAEALASDLAAQL